MEKVKKRKAILITLFLLVLIKAAFSGEWGDVNDDGNINIVDALLVAQYYVGLVPQVFLQDTADVSADGSVNIVDALLISQYYVGLIDEFPASTADTPAPTPWSIDPVWSCGLHTLDGIDDYVEVPAGITDNLYDFTISVWARLNSIDSWSRIFDFGIDTTYNMFLTPSSDSGAVRFAITVSGASGEEQINGSGTLATGSWQYVAVVKSNNTGIVYVNGMEVGRNSNMTLAPADLGNTTSNYIGRSQYSDPYLNGSIDRFLIYDRALNTSEISLLADNPPEQLPTSTPTETPTATPYLTPDPTPVTGNDETLDDMPSAYRSALDWIWTNRVVDEGSTVRRNLIFDQIYAGNGELHYCIRWQSSLSVTIGDRQNIASMISRQIKNWTKHLTNYDGWPYDDVSVIVVSWACVNSSLLQNLQSYEIVYTDWINDPLHNDDPAIPIELPVGPGTCSRFDHFTDSNYTYSSCPGGSQNRFDMYLWGTTNFGGGAGGDWGQRMGDSYILNNSTGNEVTIIEHEIGHGFGLTDFYAESERPPGGFPVPTIMWAGNSATITDFDKWMLRYVWSKIKTDTSRFPPG